jgi:hypothetical protein
LATAVVFLNVQLPFIKNETKHIDHSFVTICIRKSYRSTSAGTVRINSGVGNAASFVDVIPCIGIKAAVAAIVAVSAAARNQLLFAVCKMSISSNQLPNMT